MNYPMRINKYLAEKGYATRRGADELIKEKRVRVNGAPAVLGQQIQETDRVVVRGAQKTYRYLLYNKPVGIITHSPAAHERDIIGDVKRNCKTEGVFPIGRLDKQSEGLVLLTDDGRITERLLNPDKEHEREYEVTLDKPVSNLLLKHIARGINIEGYTTKPATAAVSQKNDHVLTITLTEGKKHQVRRMCAAFGYTVVNLKRIRIMHLKITGIKHSSCRALTQKEREKLLTTLSLPLG